MGRGFLLICAILALQLAVSTSTSIDFLPVKSGGGLCNGSIAECMMTTADGEGDNDEEFAMESESARRILASRRYISYGALRRNSVPCSRRGASYYNCRGGGQANPYTRGCSRITRCRY
ncbi:Protein RALF-like 33 [Linum grandiflorum]